MHQMQFRSLCWEDLPEEEMATHSDILTWEIPWTDEPCRLRKEWDTTERLGTRTPKDKKLNKQQSGRTAFQARVCEYKTRDQEEPTIIEGGRGIIAEALRASGRVLWR